jgi:hypothetical protein
MLTILQQREIPAEHGRVLKPCTIEDYNGHMIYAEKSDRMKNNFSTNALT